MAARGTSLQHGEARGVKYSVFTEFDRHYVRGGGVFISINTDSCQCPVLRDVGSCRFGLHSSCPPHSALAALGQYQRVLLFEFAWLVKEME